MQVSLRCLGHERARHAVFLQSPHHAVRLARLRCLLGGAPPSSFPPPPQNGCVKLKWRLLSNWVVVQLGFCPDGFLSNRNLPLSPPPAPSPPLSALIGWVAPSWRHLSNKESPPDLQAKERTSPSPSLLSLPPTSHPHPCSRARVRFCRLRVRSESRASSFAWST